MEVIGMSVQEHGIRKWREDMKNRKTLAWYVSKKNLSVKLSVVIFV